MFKAGYLLPIIFLYLKSVFNNSFWQYGVEFTVCSSGQNLWWLLVVLNLSKGSWVSMFICATDLQESLHGMIMHMAAQLLEYSPGNCQEERRQVAGIACFVRELRAPRSAS